MSVQTIPPRKRVKSISPTQRALAELHKLGYVCQVVERWCAFSRRRIDLFGVIDLIYLSETSICGVQVTTASNLAARRTKILAEPRALAWVKAGGILELWGVAKRGARGERKLWTITKEEIVAEEFGENNPWP